MRYPRHIAIRCLSLVIMVLVGPTWCDELIDDFEDPGRFARWRLSVGPEPPEPPPAPGQDGRGIIPRMPEGAHRRS